MKNKLMILLIGCVALFSGCKQTEYVYKTEYITKHERDSIYMKDSIFIDRWRSGDTVYLTKEVFSIAYRDKLVRDTIQVHDSIRVPDIKYVKEKPKKTGWKYWFGCLTPIIIYILYKLLTKYLRLR